MRIPHEIITSQTVDKTSYMKSVSNTKPDVHTTYTKQLDVIQLIEPAWNEPITYLPIQVVRHIFKLGQNRDWTGKTWKLFFRNGTETAVPHCTKHTLQIAPGQPYCCP
jgi:hypothetical protein